MGKVEIFENERASGYDQFVETWIPNYHFFLDHLPKLLSEMQGNELLIVGCGTGNEIKRFIKTPIPWKITGVDPSYEMISQANEKFKNYENITLIEGLVSDISIEKKYAAATLSLVLHFLKDDGSKLGLLKDISERLSSGGNLIILDITGDKNQIKQNLEIMRVFLPDGLEKEQINNRFNRIQNELYYVPEERLSELCIEAGFEKPIRFFQSAIYMGWLAIKK